jgi:RNA-directed DNA polymerase
MIVVRYADDTVVGFQHRHEATAFLNDLRSRLAQFALSLHPEKTRLIEFGRFAAERRRARGLSKPDTFDFLGFTHICATKRNGQGFLLRRKTQRKRRWAFVHRIAQELDQRRHESIDVQGRWLRTVLQGHYAYFAVPSNLATERNIRHHIKVRWYLSLARRSQRTRLSWRRMNVVADKYLPLPRVLHPWPEQRFLVTHPR